MLGHFLMLGVFLNSVSISRFSCLSLEVTSPENLSPFALGLSWFLWLCRSLGARRAADRSPVGCAGKCCLPAAGTRVRAAVLFFLEPTQQHPPAAFKMIKTNLAPFMMEE